FELKDGIFKRFIARAKKNFEDSQKTQEQREKEATVESMMFDYFSNIELGVDELETTRGTKFYITEIDDKYIHISIPENKISNKLSLSISELKAMLDSKQPFTQVKDVTNFFGKLNPTQHFSYLLAIYKDIKKNKKPITNPIAKPDKLKPYIFI